MCMAQRIKERRIEMGFTQEELANKLGLQKSAIAKYENGRVENIKRSVIQHMAEILECSPAYLMGWDETTESNDYYIDKDAREYAEFLYKNPEYRVLFDASRKVKAEDIEFVRQMIDRMGGNTDDTGV